MNKKNLYTAIIFSFFIGTFTPIWVHADNQITVLDHNTQASQPKSSAIHRIGQLLLGSIETAFGGLCFYNYYRTHNIFANNFLTNEKKLFKANKKNIVQAKDHKKKIVAVIRTINIHLGNLVPGAILTTDGLYRISRSLHGK